MSRFQLQKHWRNCRIYFARWSRYKSYVNNIDTTYTVLDLVFDKSIIMWMAAAWIQQLPRNVMQS